MDRRVFNHYGLLAISAASILVITEATSAIRRFPPDDCLPMSDASYDPYRHKGHKKDIVELIGPGTYSRKLYCYYGCCGDGTNTGMQCCLAPEDSGTNTLKMVSIIAAGVIGLFLVVISLLHYIKAHNKKKRMIADIQSLQKSEGKKRKKNRKAKTIKVGEYQRDQMNRGGHSQGQWNQAPQGNIFVTKQALPSIQPSSKPSADPLNPLGGHRDPSGFSTIIPAAGSTDLLYNSRSHDPVPPPVQYYDPDQEVLKSIIANLPGPKVMPDTDRNTRLSSINNNNDNNYNNNNGRNNNYNNNNSDSFYALY